jgi:S-DNA-T family DNA segregation ATPase FtsK/SpoIIIE
MSRKSAAKKPVKQRGGRLLRYLWGSLFLLLIVIVAVIIWRWADIVSMFENITTGIGNTLGWGLLLIVIGLLALVLFVLIKQVPSFVHWVRIAARILGAISILLAFWVILGLIGAGGNVGATLVGGNILSGILRILAFLVVGIFLIAPVVAARTIARFFRWSFGKLRPPRRPVRKVKPVAAATTKAVAEKPGVEATTTPQERRLQKSRRRPRNSSR